MCTVIAAFVAGDIGAGDVRHGAIVGNLANDSGRDGTRVPVVGPKQCFIEGSCQMRPIEKAPVKFEKGLDLRVNKRVPGGLGLPISDDCNDDTVGGRGCDSGE